MTTNPESLPRLLIDEVHYFLESELEATYSPSKFLLLKTYLESV